MIEMERGGCGMEVKFGLRLLLLVFVYTMQRLTIDIVVSTAHFQLNAQASFPFRAV